MFEKAQQQEQYQQQQHHKQQQQHQLHHQQQQQNLCLNFNVRINVNVNTKTSRIMSTMPMTTTTPAKNTTKNTIAPGQNRTPTTTTAKSLQKLQHQHLHQIQIQFNTNNSISMLLIINSLFLILLCCGTSLCASSVGTTSSLPLSSSAVTTPSLLDIGEQNFAQNINRNLTKLFSDETEGFSEDDIVIVEHISQICLQRCDDEADVFKSDFGINNDGSVQGATSFKTRCTKGCQQWWHALQEFESCQDVCSSTNVYPYDMPCISACEIAQRQFWHTQCLALKDYVGGIVPQILNATEQLNSLALNWPVVLPDYLLANRPFYIQYQYADNELNDNEDKLNEKTEKGKEAAAVGDEMKWFYMTDYTCNDRFQCDILELLTPYTSYRFRFELPLGENPADILYSPATAVYRTAAEGLPLTSPKVLATLALDHEHIAIYWQAGKHINGPLKGYKLKLMKHNSMIEEKVFTLESFDSSFKILKIPTPLKLLPATFNQYIFNHLKPQTNYSLSLAMLNDEGIGPFANTYVVTKIAPKLSENVEETRLLLVDEYSIKLKTLEPLAETKLIYESEHLLSDVAMVMATQQLFIVDSEGTIWSLFVDTPQSIEEVKVLAMELQMKPQKITVDWLNRRLFVAGKTLNDSPNSWSIALLNFDGNLLELLATNLTEPIKKLNADPLNGWIFWTTASGLQRMNLATKDYKYIYPSPDSNKNDTTTLQNTPELLHFINDYERFLLVVYDKADNELYELSYNGNYKQKILTKINNRTANTLSLLKGEWQSFAHIDNLLLVATNGTHLMRYNYATNEYDNWMLGSDIEWCWHLLPLQPKQRHYHQPLPITRVPPNNLEVLLTANIAKITWTPPPLLLINEQLQTPAAWQEWEYELNILDVASNSAFQIRNIRTTYFYVEKLQAQNLYKFRVRASYANRGGTLASGNGGAGISSASATIETPWSDEILTRTWPLSEHNFLWLTEQGGVYETNEIGTNARSLANITTNSATVSEFLQLNGTLYYVIATKNLPLHCYNLMNPELVCTIKAENVRNLAYDWRGGRLYWIDVLRNCVVRSDLSGRERELLSIFDVLYLAIDSFNGHLYYATATRLGRRSLSGTQSVQEKIFHHINGLHHQIKGFALNLQQQELYWLVQEHEGFIQLFRCSLDGAANAANITHENVSYDIKAGSLQYLNDIESLLWVSRDSSKAAIASLNDLRYISWIPAPFSNQTIAALHLRSEYTPYVDDSVIPEAVLNTSIRIDVGYWDDFNVKWDPVSSIENYTVFYKVSYNHDAVVQTLEVTEPFLHIYDIKKPQTHLNLSITPHTAWRAGPTVKVQLITPAAAPTQPQRLRVFVQRKDVPLQTAANVSALIRWEPPEKSVAGNAITAYNIYCWLGAELYAEQSLHANGPLETIIANLTEGETYTFQVQTMTAPRSTTLPTIAAAAPGEKSALHALHIDTAVQAMPRVLYTTSEHIAVMDLDSGASTILVHTSSEVEHLTIIMGEERILWVNENVELMNFIPGTAPMKLARMRAEVLGLTVDWIARIVFWAEVNATTDSVDIYALNLCDFEGKVMQGNKLLSLRNGRQLRDMHVLPFSRVLLWLEFTKGEENAQLAGYKLSNLQPLKLKMNNSLLRMFEGAQLADQETINIVDTRGKMCAFDVQRQLCTPQKMHYDVQNRHERLELSRDAGYIYVLRNESLRVYNRRRMGLEYHKDLPQARKIKAYNYQEYPRRECMVPELKSGSQESMNVYLQPDIEELEETFITLELPSLQTNAERCSLQMPGIKYSLTLSDPSNATRLIETDQNIVNITDLQPFTSYWLQLNISTYYQQKLGLPLLVSARREVMTARGTPSEPRNLMARAVSPHEIYVNWEPPAVLNSDVVYYELHWQQLNATHSAQRLLNTTELSLPNLEPSESYLLSLKVYSTAQKFNASKPQIVNTYGIPEPLELVESTAYNLTLSWQPNAEFTSIVLVCATLNAGDAFSMDITGSNTSQIVISDLMPKTRYQFHLELQYGPNTAAYHWPEFFNERFVFETLGDAPSAPGRPQIELITGDIFKVFWQPASENGAAIIEYSLEALQLHKRQRRSIAMQSAIDHNNNSQVVVDSHFLQESLPWLEEPKVLEDKWISYCNTTELSCIVRDLHTQRLLMFRVRARNEPYGWGPYSIESEYIAEPYVTAEKRTSLMWAIIAPAAVVSSCVAILYILKKIQNRRFRSKQTLLAKSRPSIWSNLSAVQQHQLMSARNRGFSITSNSTSFCGGMNGGGVCNPLSDADIALLPQIKWHQITILNFLGSGAFGEVYEGLLRYDDDDGKPEKVAIKSLRKGSSEFSELLQEAQLMSNFKHDNIVRLIGVCFDPDSISIIMEHMEGGDLLSFLREARPTAQKALASLQLLDLITMCIDVATGCCYLEDMHFVHRDLACRNCLVSSKLPSKRVVKIGDFGLARDIYKNDYYRKEGEGLMPIRWMAPESLIDGIFTMQTDVWAFGVLCWEIMTLGRQPYAMRNNFEVLNFVKDGGRLEQPDNCPDKLFNLMQQCWQTDAEARPSFRRCLNTLISIKTELRRINLGYNLDDVEEHAMYANSHGILLSNFLAGPLPKVEEFEECVDIDMPTESTISVNGDTCSNVKVHFPNDLENEDASQDTIQSTKGKYTQIIAIKSFSEKDPETVYSNNEGVSRF